MTSNDAATAYNLLVEFVAPVAHGGSPLMVEPDHRRYAQFLMVKIDHLQWRQFRQLGFCGGKGQ
jgi:hypothetical protein